MMQALGLGLVSGLVVYLVSGVWYLVFGVWV